MRWAREPGVWVHPREEGAAPAWGGVQDGDLLQGGVKRD